MELSKNEQLSSASLNSELLSSVPTSSRLFAWVLISWEPEALVLGRARARPRVLVPLSLRAKKGGGGASG